MFLAMPAMLRYGVGFWPALGASCALTIFLYAVVIWLLVKLGVSP